jgi:phage terminase Nu1 subunit (DNA packaging protein)
MPYVTQTALAAYVDITRETISDHVARGTIKKRADGKYDLQESVRGIIKWQSGKLSGRIGSEELAAQRVRLAAAQAQAAEMRNAVFCGDWVSLEAFARVFERHVIVFRERCLSVPGKVADGLTPHCVEDRFAIELVLRDQMYEALEDIANPEFMKQAADEVAGRNRSRRLEADRDATEIEETTA